MKSQFSHILLANLVSPKDSEGIVLTRESAASFWMCNTKAEKSQQSNDICTGQNPKLVKKGITIIMLQDFHNVEVETKDSPTRECRLILLEKLALEINYKKRALSNQWKVIAVDKHSWYRSWQKWCCNAIEMFHLACWELATSRKVLGRPTKVDA